MNRRGFLKTLGALALAAGLPPIATRWAESGQIIGETFFLDAPLELDLPDYFVISDCKFIANPGFVGTHLLKLVGQSKFGNIINCYFDGTHMQDGCALNLSAMMTP